MSTASKSTWTGGQTATLPARKEQIKELKRARVVPFLLLSIPMVVLLVAMMLRFEAMGARLQDLPTLWKYLISIVIVLFITALLFGNVWFAGFGNKLGDISRALQRIAVLSRDQLQDLHEEVRQQLVVSEQAVATAGQELLKVKAMHLRPARSVESGRYAVAAAHGVTEVPALDYRAIVTRTPCSPTADTSGETLPSLDEALYGEKPVWEQYAHMQKDLLLVQGALSKLQTAAQPVGVGVPERRADATERIRNPWDVLANKADTTPDRTQLGEWMTEQHAADRMLFPSAEPTETHRKSTLWIGVVVLVLLIAAALTWYLLNGSSAQAMTPTPTPTSTTASPTTTSTTIVDSTVATTPPAATGTAVAKSTTSPGTATTGGTLIPANPAMPAGLKEGVDFSYLEKTAGGGHVRWQCDAPIEVVIAGPADAATRGQVSTALKDVIRASDLPLALGHDLPTLVTGPAEVQTDEITISFLSTSQITAAHLDMDQDTLGRTDTRSGGSDIDAATVVIRTGIDSYTLQETLMHELGHAVGLGHAADGEPEIMKPVTETLTAVPNWDRRPIRTQVRRLQRKLMETTASSRNTRPAPNSIAEATDV